MSDERVIVDWTPTMIMRTDAWRGTRQLWVRLREIEIPEGEHGVAEIKEVSDHVWRDI